MDKHWSISTICSKRHSPSSLSPHREKSADRLAEVRSNSALFLENIKQEVESLNSYHGTTPLKMQNDMKWRSSLESHGISGTDFGVDVTRQGGSISLKTCKQEHDAVEDDEETTFSLFASLLDSALKGSLYFNTSILSLILYLHKKNVVKVWFFKLSIILPSPVQSSDYINLSIAVIYLYWCNTLATRKEF